MIRNYFLTAWRNLRQHRFTATINIIGLSVAFLCCMLLFLLVHYEFSYDGFQRDRDRLYMAYDFRRDASGDSKGQSLSYPLAPGLKAEVPGIEASTAYM